MFKHLVGIVFALLLSIGAASACTAPPQACNVHPGLVVPGTNVIGIDAAGYVTLAPNSDPQWDWPDGLSYIYTAPQAPTEGGTSYSDRTWTVTWSLTNRTTWNDENGQSAQVKCFMLNNDGTVWYSDSSTVSLTSGSFTCYFGDTSGGHGPRTWFNSSGGSAYDNASSYGNSLTDTNLFAIGLIFGDSNCTPNWFDQTAPGNPGCWAVGVPSGGHITFTSSVIQ